MKHILATLAAALLLTSLAAKAAEDTPTAHPTPAENTSKKEADVDQSVFARFEYSHSLGYPYYLHDTARGISIGDGAISDVALNAGFTQDSISVYLGIGYNWLGKLQQNGIDMNQSANKVLLQIGFERQFFNLLSVGPRIGLSAQYLPQFLSSMPDETNEPNEIRFKDGAGFKAYVGLGLPKGYFVNLGYQVMFLFYKDGPGITSPNDFTLSYRGAFFALGWDL